MDNVPTSTNYPVPRHEPDHRLSYGLLLDLRVVLLRHGYPELTSDDLADLLAAANSFLYGPRPTSAEYERDRDNPTGQPLPAGIQGIPTGTRAKRRNQR
ncbi:hypothetical protein [Micromonospora sp. NPDC023814]|uniref:hypothetical protein n=1 Tax=Micromonospora sp. NPDC023814 TaxID=3154596 RepID=UPI0033D633B3